MFDERRLLKSIEQEEKAGVTLVFDEITFSVIGHRWMAETTRARLIDKYRAVLGHIVEVLGYIPENEIVRVTKIKGDYKIENPMPEVVSEDIAEFMRRDRLEPVKHTGLFYGGDLYQTRDGVIRRRTVHAASAGGSPVLISERIIMSADSENNEATYYETDRPREDTATDRGLMLWEHLESVLWNEWDPEPGGEIEGQEEISNEQ